MILEALETAMDRRDEVFQVIDDSEDEDTARPVHGWATHFESVSLESPIFLRRERISATRTLLGRRKDRETGQQALLHGAEPMRRLLSEACNP